LKVNDENSRIRIRIRIHKPEARIRGSESGSIKTSWIRNTARNITVVAPQRFYNMYIQVIQYTLFKKVRKVTFLHNTVPGETVSKVNNSILQPMYNKIRKMENACNVFCGGTGMTTLTAGSTQNIEFCTE
jgi:hypothetical protein